MNEHVNLKLLYNNEDVNYDFMNSNYKEDITKALTTMKVIRDNLQHLYLECGEVKDLKNILNIEVDFAMACDEFDVIVQNGSCIGRVEVVTSEVAESNDLDFIDDEDEIKEYELGGDLSSYSQLGNTDYWYRLM